MMEINDLDFCFLGKKSTFKGDIYLNGPTHIASNVEGKIIAETNSKISIEPSSIIKGSIDSYDIDIYGKVEGDVNSKGVLRLFPSAIVTGQVSARSLEIRPGAILNATSQTSDDN